MNSSWARRYRAYEGERISRSANRNAKLAGNPEKVRTFRYEDISFYGSCHLQRQAILFPFIGCSLRG
jgi:hypothetical protein